MLGVYCSAKSSNTNLRFVNVKLMREIKEALLHSKGFFKRKRRKKLLRLEQLLLKCTFGDNHTTLIYDRDKELSSQMQRYVTMNFRGLTSISTKISVLHTERYSYVIVWLHSHELTKMQWGLTKQFGFESDYPVYRPHVTLLTLPRAYEDALTRKSDYLIEYYTRELLHKRFDFGVPTFYTLND